MDINQVAARLAEAALHAPVARAAAVLLLDAADGSLRVAAAQNLPPEYASRSALALRDTPLDQRALSEERGVVFVNDRTSDPAGLGRLPGFAFTLAYRLGPADQPLGVLRVFGDQPILPPGPEVERLVALAALGASAIEAVAGLRELERIEGSKAQFIRVATHELRSPVTVAQSLVRTVLKGYAGPLADRQRDIFGRVSGQLDFLEGLVNDLLDLAASQATELAENESPVSLYSSVGRVVLVLQPRADDKGIRLTFSSCREELPVLATEEGLDRIFSNLIGNAIKYTPAGGQVTVNVCVSGADAEVSIADTGIGIPPEALPHLFEEFYRAPNARTSTIGTGLGLAIVKTLVERFHGRISIQSTLGQGTIFTVHLPLLERRVP